MSLAFLGQHFPNSVIALGESLPSPGSLSSYRRNSIFVRRPLLGGEGGLTSVVIYVVFLRMIFVADCRLESQPGIEPVELGEDTVQFVPWIHNARD